MQRRTKDILKFVLFVGIGVFFVCWFLLKLEPEQKQAIWQSFIHANYAWVAIVMGVCILSNWVRALRWQLLLKALGHPPRFINTFGAVNVTYMANLAFPRLGDVLRCGVLRTSDDVPIEQSLGTVVTERMVDVLAFVVVVIGGVFVAYAELHDWLLQSLPSETTLRNLTILGVVAVVLLIAAIWGYRRNADKLRKRTFFQRVDNILRGFADGLKSIFRLHGRQLFSFVLYSLMIYLLYIIGGLLLFNAIPATQGLGFKAAYVVYIFGSVGMAVSQGGIGVYPVLVWLALSVYNIGQEDALAYGWLLWGSQQVIVIIVGLFFMVRFSLLKRKNIDEQQQM